MIQVPTASRIFVQKNVDDWVQQNQHCPYTVDSMKWSLTRCRNTKSMFMPLCGHDAQALFFGSILNFSQLHDNINSIIVLQISWLLGEAGKLQDIDQKLHYNVSFCPLPDRSPSSTAPHLRKFKNEKKMPSVSLCDRGSLRRVSCSAHAQLHVMSSSCHFCW